MIPAWKIFSRHDRMVNLW